MLPFNLCNLACVLDVRVYPVFHFVIYLLFIYFRACRYGTDLAYVGIKLARYITPGSLMVISGQNYSTSTHTALHTLLEELSIVHSLHQKQLTAKMIDSFYALPDVFHYQFLGVETFYPLATLGANFISYLGRLLSLARVSFLTLIPPDKLKMIAKLLHPNAPPGHGGVFPGMVEQALRRVGVTDFKISLLHPSDTDDQVARRILRVEIVSAKREVNVDCGDKKMTLTREKGVVKLENAIDGHEYTLHRAHAFISFQFVLAMSPDGLSNSDRAHYFKQYVDMRQQDDMCPVHMLVAGGSLVLTNLLADTPATIAKVGGSHLFMRSTHTLLNDTIQALEATVVTPFSLLEHNSGRGNVSMAIASKFPNDTVISVEADAALAKGHWKEIKRNNGPFNNIVCNMNPGATLFGKLLESPEVLRYQFAGWPHLKTFLGSDVGKLGEILGTAFGTGVTTFLQLPSTRSLSVAFATLYPELVTKAQRQQILGPAAVPLPGLVDLEKHFIAEITKLTSSAPHLAGKSGVSVPDHQASNLSTNIQVAPHVVPAVPGKDGYSPSWRLLRIDVRKLEFQVNHHFDYRIDGYSISHSVYDGAV